MKEVLLSEWQIKKSMIKIESAFPLLMLMIK